MFGGFYIKISSLPPLLNLIPYVSAFYYGFRGLNIAEFKGQTFSCPSDWDPQECVLTGEEALRQLGMQGETVGDAMFGLSMLVIAYGVALYFLLLANEERYVALGWIGGGWRKYEKETGGESVTEKTGELGVAGEGGENGRGNSYQLLYGDDRQGERVGVAAAQVGVVSENIGAEGDQAAATP
ncbi:hypothetical protein EON65_11170 [archaeon]|nr:MAG: hypothetical protein EON65_11170 [archaeon]